MSRTIKPFSRVKKESTANMNNKRATKSSNQPVNQPANLDSEPDNAPNVDFNPADFEQVELSRKWFRPGTGIDPLYCMPLARSEDVRSLYPSDYPGQDERPLYVWAVEVIADYAPQADGGVILDGEKASAKRGEVVFLFEPVRLRDFLVKAQRAHVGVAIQSVEKREIKSRTWGKVNAWHWIGRMRPVVMHPSIDPNMLMLPSADNAGDMPAQLDE
jgi:hypothetical protein